MGAHKRIAILDHQKEFVERLTSYMERKENFPFEVIGFTDDEELINYEKSNTIDLLLCEDTIAYGSASDYKAEKICLLTDYLFVNEAARYPTIFKYQSAEKIIQHVTELISEGQEEQTEPAKQETRVFGVCSPSGGSCKSTLALALALKHAKREKTLFLSFDPFYNIPGTKKEEREQNLSDVIYFLKESHGNVHMKIKAVTRHNGKLDYILGVAHWIDLFELTSGELRGLIDEIIVHMSYDAIVIDMGNFGMTSMDLLSYCDTIYVPNLCDGHLEKEKEREWKRQLKFIGGEKMLNKLCEVEIPIDENLSGDGYTLETIEYGAVGNFVEELFFKNEYAFG